MGHIKIQLTATINFIYNDDANKVNEDLFKSFISKS